MRYAVLTAALFGGAIFLASSNQAPSADAHTINTVHKPVIQAIALADPAITLERPAHHMPTEALPRVVAAAADTSAPTTAVKAAADTAPASVMVTVAAGDSLTTLAAQNGTTYQRLYDANPAVGNPDLIYPGQELRVPSAGEVLTARALPAAAPVVADAAPAPTVAKQVASTAPAVTDGSVWDRLSMCEAGGNWAINTGNGFYGGLQFTLGSWQGVGGTGYPNEASREEQILRGQMLQAKQGWGAWPACTAKLGIS